MNKFLFKKELLVLSRFFKKEKKKKIPLRSAQCK